MKTTCCNWTCEPACLLARAGHIAASPFRHSTGWSNSAGSSLLSPADPADVLSAGTLQPPLLSYKSPQIPGICRGCSEYFYCRMGMNQITLVQHLPSKLKVAPDLWPTYKFYTLIKKCCFFYKKKKKGKKKSNPNHMICELSLAAMKFLGHYMVQCWFKMLLLKTESLSALLIELPVELLQNSRTGLLAQRAICLLTRGMVVWENHPGPICFPYW